MSRLLDVSLLQGGLPVTIFVVAAVLTPSPDWVSQVMLGVPMVILYLVGVGVAFAFGPKRVSQPASSLPVRTDS